MYKKPEKMKDMTKPENEFYKVWNPMIKEEIKKINPDVVVSDFVSRAGTLAADDLGIPCLINCPALVDFLDQYNAGGMINLKKNSSNCCGMICIT